MKSIKYIILLAVIISTSCVKDLEKEIDWEVKGASEFLIVEGHITNELKKHKVVLKKSDTYFGNKYLEGVSNADVRISDGVNEVIYEENPIGSGVYYTMNEIAGEAGKTYTLDINLNKPINGATHYHASSLLEKGIDIDTVMGTTFENPFQFEETDSVLVLLYIFGQEPYDELNNYMIKIQKNDTILTDTIDEVIIMDDILHGINGNETIAITYDETFTENDTAGVEIWSIPKDYYEFIDGIRKVLQGSDPLGLSAPPANPRSNIKGSEAIGFFFASYVSSAKTTVEILVDE